MTRLMPTEETADILVVDAITSAFPPLTGAYIPDSWGDGLRGVVSEFDVDVSADGATAPTAMTLHGVELEPVADSTIADTTFTANATTNAYTDASHGLITGDGPVRLTNSGGALPAGLLTDTDYYIIFVDTNTYKLATSRANAFTGTAVDISSAGTGTHTLSDTATTRKCKLRDVGVLNSAPTLTERRGFCVRVSHRPRFVAYQVSWVDGTTNSIKVKLCPVVKR